MIKTLYEHESEILALSFSNNNEYLASGSKNGKIIIWNLDNFTKCKSLAFHIDSI